MIFPGRASREEAFDASTIDPHRHRCGQVHPNLTRPWDSFEDVLNCSTGCLFDIVDDPEERRDLALVLPRVRDELYGRLANASFYDPDRGSPDARACEVAAETGFWGPFLD